MNKKELKEIWYKKQLSCRDSFVPEYCRKFCEDLGLKFPEELIYTKDKYRESSNGKPRVDGEELLEYICKEFNITPDKEKMKTANMMHGEGSRRGQVEKAYLE